VTWLAVPTADIVAPLAGADRSRTVPMAIAADRQNAAILDKRV
jgi:hypothetical protein